MATLNFLFTISAVVIAFVTVGPLPDITTLSLEVCFYHGHGTQNILSNKSLSSYVNN